MANNHLISWLFTLFTVLLVLAFEFSCSICEEIRGRVKIAYGIPDNGNCDFSHPDLGVSLGWSTGEWCRYCGRENNITDQRLLPGCCTCCLSAGIPRIDSWTFDFNTSENKLTCQLIHVCEMEPQMNMMSERNVSLDCSITRRRFNSEICITTLTSNSLSISLSDKGDHESVFECRIRTFDPRCEDFKTIKINSTKKDVVRGKSSVNSTKSPEEDNVLGENSNSKLVYPYVLYVSLGVLGGIVSVLLIIFNKKWIPLVRNCRRNNCNRRRKRAAQRSSDGAGATQDPETGNNTEEHELHTSRQNGQPPDNRERKTTAINDSSTGENSAESLLMESGDAAKPG